MEVDELPGVHAPTSITTTRKLFKAKAVKITLVALAISASTYFVKRPSGIPIRTLEDDATNLNLCPQVDELVPEKNGMIWGSLHHTYNTEEFKARAVDWLGGAVRIPCVVSPHDMPRLR